MKTSLLLNTACVRTEGKDIPTLIAEGNYKAVVSGLLNVAGLNYGALPKVNQVAFAFPSFSWKI